MDANRLSSLSQADTDAGMGEFWDTHDFTEFDNPDLPDAKFTVVCAVPIEVELFAAIEKQAHQRGVQVETLANLWLQQKLVEQMQQAAV
jgi:hypothetical protein